MKKFTKIVLILAAVLAGLGILFGGIATAMGAGGTTIRDMAEAGEFDAGGWHFKDGIYYEGNGEDDGFFARLCDKIRIGVFKMKDGGDETAGVSTPADGITEILLDLDMADVTVQTSDDTDEIKVEMRDGYKELFRAETSETTFQVTYDTKDTVYDEGPEIILTVPKQYHAALFKVENAMGDVVISDDFTAGEADVTVDMGDFTAESGLSAGTLHVSCAMGDISIEDGKFDGATLDASMGDIDFSGKINQKLDVTCGMGDVEIDLSGAEDDYNYKLSCGMGEVTLNGASLSAFLDGKDEADVTYENAEADLSVDCGMGDVAIETTGN